MKILFIVLIVGMTGCAQVKPYVDVGCLVTTEEGRAEVRSKQNIKTDICGDLRGK